MLLSLCPLVLAQFSYKSRSRSLYCCQHFDWQCVQTGSSVCLPPLQSTVCPGSSPASSLSTRPARGVTAHAIEIHASCRKLLQNARTRATCTTMFSGKLCQNGSPDNHVDATVHRIWKKKKRITSFVTRYQNCGFFATFHLWLF